MKKVCRSFPASLPVPLSALRFLWLLAAFGLGPAALAAVGSEHGSADLLSRAPASPHVYLSVLGPAPLRIHSPSLPSPTAQLPPLPMFDPPPPASSPDSATNQAAKPPSGATPVLSAPTAPALPLLLAPGPEVYGPPSPDEAAGLVADSTVGALPSAPIVTPQMLVQFFKPLGSNCLGGTWSVPVFVPPSPPATKPSSATYQSQ